MNRKPSVPSLRTPVVNIHRRGHNSPRDRDGKHIERDEERRRLNGTPTNSRVQSHNSSGQRIERDQERRKPSATSLTMTDPKIPAAQTTRGLVPAWARNKIGVLRKAEQQSSRASGSGSSHKKSSDSSSRT